MQTEILEHLDLIELKRKVSGEKAGGVRRVQRRLDPGRLKPIPRVLKPIDMQTLQKQMNSIPR